MYYKLIIHFFFLNRCSRFKKLYSNNYKEESKEVRNIFLDTEVNLSETDKDSCEGSISLDECTLVLKMMKKRKKSLIRWFY